MSRLPEPRMTATVRMPPNRASFGRVIITRDSAMVVESDAPEAEEAPSRAPHRLVICSRCKLPGHARSNRKFHPRTP